MRDASSSRAAKGHAGWCCRCSTRATSSATSRSSARCLPPFSARALSDISYLRVGGGDLLRIVKTNPNVCHRLLFSLASRLQRMQHRLIEVTRSDLKTQVAALLLDETEGQAGQVALSQRVIAERSAPRDNG